MLAMLLKMEDALRGDAVFLSVCLKSIFFTISESMVYAPSILPYALLL